jgi:hypothetical protein
MPLPQSDRDYLDELHRIVAAIDRRIDRLEALLIRYLVAMGHEPPPPSAPPPVH